MIRFCTGRRVRAWLGLAATVGLVGGTLATAPVGAQDAKISAGRSVQVSLATSADTHYEVLAAADPADAAHMVVGSFIFPEGGAAPGTLVYATHDGGRSWSPTLRGAALNNTSDPAPAYGPGGVTYYSAASLGPPGTPRSARTMLLFRSSDGGATWQPPVSLTYMDRQYVTVDHTGGKFNGRIYVNGNSRAADRISDFVVFTSTDGGRTFSGPAKRPDFGKHQANTMGNAVVASDGTLIGTFIQDRSLMAIMSVDGGQSLTPAVTIDSQFVPAGDRKGAHGNVVGMPIIAIDASHGPYRDHLYVVWADRRAGPSRILLASSADGGATWSPAREVDASTPSDTTDQSMPTVAVNSAGVVGVLWYDRRNHPDTLGWDPRYTASLDGGRSFLPSVQVSTQGTTFGPATRWTALRSSVARAKDAEITVDVSLNNFMLQGGDTDGLVADASGVFHPFWIGNSTGTPQIWTAPVRVTPGSTAASLSSGTDVSDRVTLDVVGESYDRASRTLTAVVRLHNTSAQAVRGPFRVELLDISSQLGDMAAQSADNGRTGPGAAWAFADSSLSAGAESRPRTLRFTLSNPQPLLHGDRYRLGLLQLRLRVTDGESPSRR